MFKQAIKLLLALTVAQSVWSLDRMRIVSETSCKPIKVNLALGMTTQLVFDQTPKLTLYADKIHFKISTNKVSKRSLAIIPDIKMREIESLRSTTKGHFAQGLDKSFHTNLFVFFEGNAQLMFDLRFVEKEKADYIVKITQVFNEDCVL
ncbi:MAG: hypothetical protein COT74_09875 [Bdellovibrionales bacterium CG10_big_fil_rev_8_21_14_0_10_45_34]|nr:MAG: hypothetical protein COT74_09875 [Bdellovibrionales bacterium CG10_big_fil_rev_8_21_14_0_10_45_34]